MRLFLLFALSLLCAPARAEVPTLYAVAGVEVDALLARMSLEEKVGQLLFLGFGGSVMDDTVRAFLLEKKPGAVALFSRNIKTVPQTLTLIREVRKLDPAGIPIFISVDQEGGNVVRLTTHATVLPSNMALGAAGSDELAERAGRALGRDLRLMGFNMNLAPVLDVNSNPDNPVIGIRSFGGSPELVGRMGTAFTRGMQAEGVSAVAKHFPGHGDTSTDSHFAMPQLSHDHERLLAVELRPFARALAEGLDAVMTAHISLPRIAEEPEMPATVSYNVLTEILREQLGYDGLIVTDGLEMEGIISRYGSGEAAVRAVEAGADMVMVLWFSERKDEVHRALLKAVKTGRISEARLERSVRRVLATKARRGLFAQELLPADEALKALLDDKHRAVVDEIAARAITLVKNEGGVLPLARGTRVFAAATEPRFLSELSQGLGGAPTLRLAAGFAAGSQQAEAERIARAAKGARAEVVVLGFMGPEWGAVVAGVQERLPGVKVVAVSFSSPYALSRFPGVEGYVCAFGFRNESEIAAAKVLLGELPPRGSLPVDLPTGQRMGHGFDYQGAAASP
jgi:beta-N-acetylhexosaminidase